MDEAFLSGPPASHRSPGHPEMTGDYSAPSGPFQWGFWEWCFVHGPGLPDRRLGPAVGEGLRQDQHGLLFADGAKSLMGKGVCSLPRKWTNIFGKF